MGNSAAFAPLLSRLQKTYRLEAADLDAISGLPINLKRLGPNHTIVATGERPSACVLLVDGFIYRSKASRNGGRQILSIHQPGDIPDLQSLYLLTMDHDVITLRECVAGFIQHSALRSLVRERPKVAEALRHDMLMDAAVFREWIVNVGHRTAESRIAHLILEIYSRLALINRTKGGRFEFPITQAQLGEATGLSTVHVNRVLQRLRTQQILESRGGGFTIQNESRLKEISEFDPAYLHNAPTQFAQSD